MSKCAANLTILLALCQALIVLLNAFGVHLTPDQQDSLIGFLSALLAVVGLWFHPSIPLGQPVVK